MAMVTSPPMIPCTIMHNDVPMAGVHIWIAGVYGYALVGIG
jgi:hypothetical protein